MDEKRCIFVFLIHDSRIEIFVILHNTNAKGKLQRAKGENIRVSYCYYYFIYVQLTVRTQFGICLSLFGRLKGLVAADLIPERVSR